MLCHYISDIYNVILLMKGPCVNSEILKKKIVYVIIIQLLILILLIYAIININIINLLLYT